jgi:hypothetical protein
VQFWIFPGARDVISPSMDMISSKTTDHSTDQLPEEPTDH